MKLYLAGPMKGYEASNYPAFHAAAKILRDLGHNVICPAESFGGDERMDMKEYARYDSFAILQVDGIVLLEGWEKSTGACTEVTLGQWLNLQFFLFHPTGIESFIPLSPIRNFIEYQRKVGHERQG